MPRIDFVYFNAGGGHRSAALALQEVIASQNRPWQIRLVNLRQVLEPLDFLGKWTGLGLEDLYNLILKKGWTLGTPQALRVMQAAIRALYRKQVELLHSYWRQDAPDLAVSFVPHFNGAMAEALEKANSTAPLVTIITDLADYPPNFWLESPRQYVIAGTPKAADQARQTGIPPEKIFLVSGMILSPRFYDDRPLDRRAERTRLGLDPDKITGLVLFGGQGSAVMESIARRLDASTLDLQLIFICGHNQRLAQRLRAMSVRFPKCVEGFTPEIPYYMRLSDFFIGKPGPGSLSEALHMKLPVIVERNAWTLPQERYNTDWIVENGLGIVVRSFRQIAQATAELLRPERFETFRSNAAALDNRAVYEIPQVLAKLLDNAHGNFNRAGER